MDNFKNYILNIISNSLYSLRDLDFLTQQDVKEISGLLLDKINTIKKKVESDEVIKEHKQVSSQQDWDKVF